LRYLRYLCYSCPPSQRRRGITDVAVAWPTDSDSGDVAWDKAHGVRAIDSADSSTKLSRSKHSDALEESRRYERADRGTTSDAYDAHAYDARMRRMERLHGGYQRQKPVVTRQRLHPPDPLSVRKQEPGGDKAVIASGISWDTAHGVRAIDSLERLREARSTDLADIGGDILHANLSGFGAELVRDEVVFADETSRHAYCLLKRMCRICLKYALTERAVCQGH